MGMDLLDITFRLEKAIGIKIPSGQFWDRAIEDFEVSAGRFKKDVRVKRLHELLCELTTTPADSCFDPELRRQHVMQTLQRCFEVSKDLLKPETKLDDIVPKKKRFAEWQRFAEAVSTSPPKLHFPTSIFALGCLTGIVAIGFLIAGIRLLIAGQPQSFGVMTLMAFGFLIACGVLLARPRRTVFAENCKTIDDLTRAIACLDAATITQQSVSATNAGNARPQPNPWTADLLWQVLKEALVNGLGVDEDEVVPEALLLRDLGCE